MKKIRTKKVAIHCDGSSTNNGQEDSYGSYGYVVLNNNVLVQEESEFKTNVTNNQMEMLGAITALEWCFNNNLKNVQLYSDSKYLVKGCSEWMIKWKKNNWMTSDGFPVKNKMYWKELDHLINKMDIWFTWEKGHANNEWNNYVDMLCSSTVESNSGISFESYETLC